ncbi:MAG: hypothetical protein ACUZ8H_07385, partial [Candidatus Anammoxibacter sp.]
RYLRLNEAKEESFQKLKKVAQKYSIENDELDNILDFYAKNSKKEGVESTQQIVHSNHKNRAEHIDWEKIFNDLALTTSSGISHAIKSYDAISTKFRQHDVFWKEVFNRINESDAVKFFVSSN